MIKISAAQMSVLGQRQLLRSTSRFREILIQNRTLAASDERDEELRQYLLSGWNLGLRQAKDLAMFATVCFRAGGDVAQVASLRAWIGKSLDAAEGPMTHLLRSLPVTYWVHLSKKIPHDLEEQV